ncbi:MAG TPA: tripartite tricarboxylate transporter TctB family protein [Syntrophales bacterium]|nr:tripartite tricarboxylate transporter TctB family protein [Syntrophales bacterium]
MKDKYRDVQTLIFHVLLFAMFAFFLLNLDSMVSGKSLSLQAQSSPKLFPFWILMLLVGFTGIQLFKSVRIVYRQYRENHRDDTNKKNVDECNSIVLDEEQRTPRILFSVIMIVVLTVFIMKYLGFIVAAMFMLTVTLFMLGKRDLKSLLIIPVGVFLAVFMFFAKLLAVPFPRGIGVFAEISRYLY